MNEQLSTYLADAPELYPHRLEERFPRIVNKLVAAWPSPDSTAAVFDDLLIDRRGGRQGFPPEIAREIFQLSIAYERLRAKPAEKKDVWGEDRARATTELKELGYKPVAADMLRVAESGDAAQLLLFVKAGVAVDVRDAREWTPLMVAAFNGNEAAAKLLLENGADVYARDAGGYTPLHWAAFKGYQEVVALLAKRIDVNIQSKSGLTPLLQAAATGHAPVVQLLLAAGADPNRPTNDGFTPLHKAVANGHAEVVRFLLAAGASVYVKHTDGTTPLALATKKKRDDIVQMLRMAERAATLGQFERHDKRLNS